jgi:hypothetical protein
MAENKKVHTKRVKFIKFLNGFPDSFFEYGFEELIDEKETQNQQEDERLGSVVRS